MSASISLPEPIWFSGNWSEWATFVERYYEVFTLDFLTPPKPRFQGKSVQVNGFIGPNDEGKPAIFWHLTTKEHANGGRDPDPNRAERINWIRFLIEKHKHFKTWKYLEAKERLDYRWYIWAETEDFVVILSERNGYFQLITSFWVEDWNIPKLSKKYKKREQEP